LPYIIKDVPHDIFHKDPVESYWGNNKANNFYQIMKKKLIVVFHNGTDKALAWSSWYENNERRIGQRGMGTSRNWR